MANLEMVDGVEIKCDALSQAPVLCLIAGAFLDLFSRTVQNAKL
jgi:hypothetical protein